MHGCDCFIESADEVGPVGGLNFDGCGGLGYVNGDGNWSSRGLDGNFGGGGRGRLVIVESVGDGGGRRGVGGEAEPATARGIHIPLKA